MLAISSISKNSQFNLSTFKVSNLLNGFEIFKQPRHRRRVCVTDIVFILIFL